MNTSTCSAGVSCFWLKATWQAAADLEGQINQAKAELQQHDRAARLAVCKALLLEVLEAQKGLYEAQNETNKLKALKADKTDTLRATLAALRADKIDLPPVMSFSLDAPGNNPLERLTWVNSRLADLAALAGMSA